MSLSDLLQLAEQHRDRARAYGPQVFASAHKAQGDLAAVIERAEFDVEQSRVRADAKGVQAVDPERIIRLCRAGRADELMLYERRAVFIEFVTYGPEIIRAILVATPERKSRYARRLLRTWGVRVQGKRWDALVEAGGFVDSDVGISGLPLAGASLLLSDAPTILAIKFGRSGLGTLLAALAAAGLRNSGPFVLECVLQWIALACREGVELGSTLKMIMGNADLKTQLVPRLGRATEKIALDVRFPATFTSHMLAAASAKLLPEAEATAFEGIITSPNCEFGDPRLEALGPGWAIVKHYEPQAFGALVERLNSEDLKFFFDRSMQDAAPRRSFWLRYIRSIRRTSAVLDRDTAAGIEKQIPLLSARLQQAFRRARRFSSSENVSAFCMWFDHHVVVEFSRTNNATFVYSLEEFERDVRPALANPVRAKDLKVKFHARSWSHVHNWQTNFSTALATLGILPDSADSARPANAARDRL